MTNEELVGRVTHRLRASLAVIAGYCEIALTRDDAALRAEAKLAVSGAVTDLTDAVDDVMLALELAWDPPPVGTAEFDLREAAEEAVRRRGARGGDGVEPGEPAWALGDHEAAVRALQALLRAAGSGPLVVTVGTGSDRATAAIEAAQAVPAEDEALALQNARCLAEQQRGAVLVEGGRLVLELPCP